MASMEDGSPPRIFCPVLEFDNMLLDILFFLIFNYFLRGDVCLVSKDSVCFSLTDSSSVLQHYLFSILNFN